MSAYISRCAMWPGLPLAFSCSSALTSSTVEKNLTRRLMLDGLHAQRRGDVGLARAGTTDEHRVLGVLHELTAMQLSHEGFIDLTVREGEACEVPVGREACQLQLVGHRAHLALGRLGLEQRNSPTKAVVDAVTRERLAEC